MPFIKCSKQGLGNISHICYVNMNESLFINEYLLVYRCTNLLSIVLNTINKSNLGRGRGFISALSPWGRIVRGGIEAKVTEECCSLASSAWPAQCFLIPLRTTCPGVAAPPPVNWALFHQSLIKMCVLLTFLQASLTEVSSQLMGRSPSSQMIWVYVRLTKSRQCNDEELSWLCHVVLFS